ncbi:UNVERIFIED_ORG: hypothetical protein M2435_005707 [Rhizobium sophorae]|nr:hypothetical protein [Rhizobium leguminosarum]MDH6662777.1 hypothetical protein [Rhizobium sophorae]
MAISSASLCGRAVHAAVGLARISSDEELSAEILVTVRDFVAGIDK